MKTTKSGREAAIALLASCIRANVDEFYADRRTYDEFTKVQRGLWDKAQADGISRDLAFHLSRPKAVAS